MWNSWHYIGFLNNADDKANISINIITSQSTKNVNSVEQNTENNNTNINNNNVSPVIIIPQSSTRKILASDLEWIK